MTFLQEPAMLPSFQKTQRLVKRLMAAAIAAINLTGIWYGIQLLQFPPSLAWIERLTALVAAPLLSLPTLAINPLTSFSTLLTWVMHPLQIHWWQVSLAQVLPFLVPLLAWISATFGRGLAIALLILVTAASSAFLTWLLMVDFPTAIAQRVNQWRSHQLKRQLRSLRLQLDQLDMDLLPVSEVRAFEILDLALNLAARKLPEYS